jgi:drug/metabolite transporter (DMT)-like permease
MTVKPARAEAPPAPDLRHRLLVLAGFAILYTWGTTFLFIRYAVETIPPFLVAGTRVLAAGVILYAVTQLRGRGATRPTRAHWGTAFFIGTLMFVGGEGSVNFALRLLPSGLGAVLWATVPMWMVVMDWALFGGRRPSLAIAAGLVLGLAGIVALVGPGQLTPAGEARLNPLGVAVILLGAVSFSFGSLYSRQAAAPDSPLVASAIWMIAGGVMLWLLAVVTGQAAQLDVAAIAPRSVVALIYLIVYGSVLGFTAYFWLLRVTSAARVASYAYVQPVVAVFLGWMVGGEVLNTRVLVASAVIVASIVLITSRSGSDEPSEG